MAYSIPDSRLDALIYCFVKHSCLSLPQAGLGGGGVARSNSMFRDLTNFVTWQAYIPDSRLEGRLFLSSLDLLYLTRGWRGGCS